MNSFQIGNFKAFGDMQTIPLKPITIIFGPNSSGKSSVIHSLLLARHAMDEKSLEVTYPSIAGKSVDLGGFRQYVHRRNGVPLGASGSLRSMLHRSLGAGSLEGFWRHWNPIFGYYLGRFVDSPLRRVVPRSAAQVLTFVVCGALHDMVTMAIRGSATFLFTPWFFFLGVGVVIGRLAGMDTMRHPWAVRAGINLTYIVACLALAILAKQILMVP